MRKLFLVALFLTTAGFLSAQDKSVSSNQTAEMAESLRPPRALPLSQAEARQYLNAHLAAVETTNVLHNNGPLITHPGQGAGGANASIITTGTTFGFGHSTAAALRVADNFVVPAGQVWRVDSVFFYAYQTGSTTTSTITSVNVRLWRGRPDSAGSTLVFGDTTTNRMIRTRFSNIYRVADANNLTNTQRPIMVQTVNLGGTLLTAGTYWLDWQTGGSLASGPWVPPVSIDGQPVVPGANALQRSAAQVWAGLVDGTNPVELPFILYGAPVALGPLNPFNLVAPPNGATVATSAGNNAPVTVSWDTSATGATYRWIFAIDSTGAPTLLSVSTTTNSFTVTLGQLDNTLASLGLQPGDSVSGFWTVWAYKSQGASGPDSLRANTWRAITFKRQAITLSPFNLVSPPDNTTLVTVATNTSPVNITWRRSGTGAVTYRWFLTIPSLTGSLPTVVRSSNNNGLDTVLTLRVSQIDSILAGAGVVAGDSVEGTWRVFAYRSATDSLGSNQAFNLKIRRSLGFSYRVEVITRAGYDSLTSGTTLALTGDDAFEAVTMPFAFSFADVPYTSINVCTNGFMNFGTGSTAFTNNLSSTTAPFNVVAPFWDDLFFHAGQSNVTTATLGTAPNRVFVIQYNNVGRFPATSAWRLNFQTRFYETTNIIEFVYGGTTPGTETFSASIGLKGATGGAGNFVDATTGSTTTANNSIAQFPQRGLMYRLIPGPPGFSGAGVVKTPPKEFKLEQNYPNPFNPTTTIQFAVPTVSDVTLEVFNVLGQKVATLVNQRMEAGIHSVQFNAANLSSGAYFYRLRAGSFTQTKKMLLVK
ncbi:MAG: T9SS type A sorting domain-containing protein [Chloroherpetonaceae bacterium]|nr:T9SS type A sorting domain-containing protein [Chloroherpetonaceae bacterium]MDW8436863.1 T9SS type A sorting domain-containing protein [Chloroherpetonaceae bacterium]